MILEPESTPDAPKISRRGIFILVCITVLATLVGWYINAVVTFAGSTSGYQNHFKSVAVSQHWFYLLWSNVEVLVAYLLVAMLFIALIYPLILLWRRIQTFGRWGVVWRALMFSGILYGFFIFRLMMNKPYFGDYSYFDEGWRKFGEWFSPAVQHGFSFFVLYIFPCVALVVCTVFYFAEIRNAFKRNPRVFPWPVILPVLLLVVMAVTGYGFIKEPPRVTEEAKPKPKPKNILILASDSFRADHLSCNGYFRPTTPNIDLIAQNGVNFQRCFTPIASTLESLTTMFSSQYPHTHGIFHMFPNRGMVAKANANAPSLAATLKAKGYDTAVIGDWCACGFH
ncbi:MAG: sulfatase-like hydrolase/transferase, partial [Verrucomicrobiaceae bacterium]